MLTRRLPLYVAALALLTAALLAAGLVPVYVALLVLAGGLLTLACGAAQRARQEKQHD